MRLHGELPLHLPEGQVHKAGTLADHCGLGIGQSKRCNMYVSNVLVMSIH